MKTFTHNLGRLAAAISIACPIYAFAVPPATSAYGTDKTNSYVHDQTSQAMEQLNDILCNINAMDPAEMVNLSTNSGNYIALIDKNICSPNANGGRGSSTNTGASYQAAVVHSSRADNASPMIANAWIENLSGPGNILMTINAYLSATQAPNPPTDPYGRFRMDFCGKSGGVCVSKGFIESTASGLAFYSSDTGNFGPGGPGGGSVTQTTQLTLNGTSAAGSGQLNQTFTGPGASGMPNASYRFAYDANYFRRSDGTNDRCFNRDPAAALESVWMYGLYDSTTGARIERNSGFPIEYTDANSVKQNGFIGYWGVNSPTTIPGANTTGATVSRVAYGAGTATKATYTLLQTGGKLIKFSKVASTLDGLDKIKFQFSPQATAGGLTAGTNYEAYWDKATGGFLVTGTQDPSTFNVIPLGTPTPVSIATMQAAVPYGLYGFSQMLGGGFAIKNTDIATLSGTTVVVYYTQDVVYPSDFAALGGMKCINNCTTAADIALSNAAPLGTPVSPYATGTAGWTGFTPGRALYSYTLDATTGNLVDAAAAQVVSTAGISTATTGNNAYGINSGRLVAAADMAALDAAVTARINAGFPPGSTAGQYLQSDIDALPTYYEWHTSGNNWDQLAILKDALGAPVRFDPPLNLSFTVPAGAQYGTFAGANVILQYGGFGNLWGIPSSCINVTDNSPCVLSGTPTSQTLQRWTPEFSIPSGSTVTVPNTQGTVAAGTAYLVKALEREVRLSLVPVATCVTAGLTLPAIGSVTLPSATSWSDPSTAGSATYIGPIPTFTTMPAPQVIHGVKMY